MKPCCKCKADSHQCERLTAMRPQREEERKRRYAPSEREGGERRGHIEKVATADAGCGVVFDAHARLPK